MVDGCVGKVEIFADAEISDCAAFVVGTDRFGYAVDAPDDYVA